MEIPEQEKEGRKLLAGLGRARREVLTAVERAAKAHQDVGLRPGHLAEGARRARAVRDAADEAVQAFSPAESGGTR